MGKLDTLLNVCGTVLAVMLTVILARGRIYRDFPFFFVYVTSSILIAVFRLAISTDYKTFFIGYWTTDVIYDILAILVAHEVFRRIFKGFYVYRWFGFLFPSVVALVAVAVALYFIQHPPARGAPPVIALVVSLQVTANLILAGIFVLFLVLMRFSSLTWRNDYGFGILDGFMVIAVVGLAYLLLSEYGRKFMTLAKYTPAVAYIIAVLIWIDTFRRPEPTVKWNSAITPQKLLQEIKEYSQVLKGGRKGLK